MNTINFGGIGKVSGGEYEDVSLSGLNTVKGSIIANTIRIYSRSTIEGSVKADSMTIKGISNIKGKLNVRFLNNTGYLKVKDKSICESIISNGKYYTAESIKTYAFKSDGILESIVDIEAENFNSNGQIIVNGALSVKTANITIIGFGCINRIKAENLKIYKGTDISVNPIIFTFIKPFLAIKNCRNIILNRLTVDEIDASQVEAEYTYAKVIKGDIVKIGHGCKIDRVEYTQSIEVAEGSKVRKKVRIFDGGSINE